MQSARRRIEEELYRVISLLLYVPFVCLFYATIRVRLTVLANIQSLFYSCTCLQKKDHQFKSQNNLYARIHLDMWETH